MGGFARTSGIRDTTVVIETMAEATKSLSLQVQLEHGKRGTKALLTKGEKVRVVGRDAKKMTPLVELGAESFVGNVEMLPR